MENTPRIYLMLLRRVILWDVTFCDLAATAFDEDAAGGVGNTDSLQVEIFCGSIIGGFVVFHCHYGAYTADVDGCQSCTCRNLRGTRVVYPGVAIGIVPTELAIFDCVSAQERPSGEGDDSFIVRTEVSGGFNQVEGLSILDFDEWE